jgi:hypothetical protein
MQCFQTLRTSARTAAWLLLGLVSLTTLAGTPAYAAHKTKNVVLIVLDGVRWQETFTGADESLLNEKYGGIWETEADLKQRFWNADPLRRR